MVKKQPLILSVESSCDDTSAAVLKGLKVLSNVVCSQEVHSNFGGVVPELASRQHMANIVPTVHEALKVANVSKEDLDAIAFTQGPGLLGSLLVGGSFIKGMAVSSGAKLIGVNHMHAHIMAHLLEANSSRPGFPFLCLTVSGGHTQIVKVLEPNKFELIGETLDDAAGEAFDKTAKLLGLPYPGGPLIDKHAAKGEVKFKFTRSRVDDFKFSFSGLKTNVLQFLKRELAKNEGFITENLNDICASVQSEIVGNLLCELEKAADLHGIQNLAIAGGVSANSFLRSELLRLGKSRGWNVFIPEFQFCTDNAAMLGAVAYYKFLNSEFSDLNVKPDARLEF